MDEPFGRTQDPEKEAERYEKVAAEYSALSKDAGSPFLRAYYQRIAEQHRKHAEGEPKRISSRMARRPANAGQRRLRERRSPKRFAAWSPPGAILCLRPCWNEFAAPDLSPRYECPRIRDGDSRGARAATVAA
jgi:hypothetical protein